MLIRKSSRLMAIISFALFFIIVMQGCSNNGSSRNPADSSATQIAPMPADTSAQPDTSLMDTASTRPVRNPH